MTERNHTLTDQTRCEYGRTFYRIRHACGREGGWAETLDSIPIDSAAQFYGNVLVFWGGVFWGGVFWGGEFWGGEFWGGEFLGGEFYSSPCCAQRSDGYMFVAKYVGGDLRIWAGCRNFSWGEAVQHWNDAHRCGAESQRIILFLKEQAEAERLRDNERSKP